MTREELKEHCKRQVQQFERVEKIMPVTPNDWKRYEEHKLVLELLEKEPKTGHWISHREHCENLGVMPSGLGAYEWCSNCDCSIDVREWHRNYYNYCPKCGARMVEPQKGEDKE